MSETSTRPKAPKTTEEMIAGMRRQIRSLEARGTAEEPDYEPSLVMAEMFSMAEELEEAGVRLARSLRERGYRWQDIGYPMGLSKQAAFNRFAHRITEK